MHQNTDNLPMGTAHSQLEAHVGSPIPDRYFAHQLTVLIHIITGTAIPPCAHKIQNRHIPAEASQISQMAQLWPARLSIRSLHSGLPNQHGLGHPGLSALSKCKTAPTSSHHSLTTNPTTSTVENRFLAKKQKQQKKEVDQG